jgi:hypothetical protein
MAGSALSLRSVIRAPPASWCRSVRRNDFEIQPTADKPLWLELRRASGEWVARVLLDAGSAR